MQDWQHCTKLRFMCVNPLLWKISADRPALATAKKPAEHVQLLMCSPKRWVALLPWQTTQAA